MKRAKLFMKQSVLSQYLRHQTQQTVLTKVHKEFDLEVDHTFR